MEDKLVLLDCWLSAYAMRVRIALAEKGLKYESLEQNLAEKSPLLLEMNPVHKMIPVLVHNGKPISESLIILEYIDEVWHHTSPLLSSDPYQRSKARFWADYIDQKIFKLGKTVWREKGEEQEATKKALIEGLKTMEGELGNKPYFGGEKLGFVDVMLVPLNSWFYSFEICANFSIEAECPKLVAWATRCMERDSVSKSLPGPLEIYAFVLQLKQKYGL